MPMRITPNTAPDAGIFPVDESENLSMRVFRHIAAAYETGDAQCWEAAHARADEALGAAAGCLLVGRATSIVRLIRVDRPDFGFLPTPCRVLSSDEAALGLLRAARLGPPPLAEAGRILDDFGAIGLLATAACALAGRDMAPVTPANLYASTSGGRLQVPN